MVNGNVRVQNQEIEQQISGLYRVKNAKAEFLIYHILLRGLNHKGEGVDFPTLIGKVEGILVFERKVNPDTEEVESGSLIHDHKTLYTIPFTKAKVDELSNYFIDSIGFVIQGSGLAGRTYSCSLEELRDLEWDELVQMKTSWMKSDYYRMKQLAAQGGGR
jgi:hypothetical protein